TPLGQKVGPLMAAGHLVPDALVIDIFQDRISQPDARSGFVLDGFPRTVVQAEKLDQLLGVRNQPIDAVVSFEVPEGEVVSRMSGRRSCPEDGSVYHVTQNPPNREGHCDLCSTPLIQRDDDREDRVRERLRVYERQTAPLKDFYQRRGLLRPVRGLGTPDDIYSDVKRAVGKG
ncbi:MAG TPA: nucleoside monophosphate kinase, partial [Myxococcaceae bacterium]|nr:nucleoside monophosphate kinase [Myxococcaceae bacterium]